MLQINKKKKAAKIQNEVQKIPYEWFKNWYIDEFKKIAIPVEKEEELKKYKINYYNGGLLRLTDMQCMKYMMCYNSMDMIIVVMKIHDNVNNRETNYATLFCELISNMSDIKKRTINQSSIVGDVVFTFHSTSPSYISADGEYRSKFCTYRINEIKSAFHEIWNEIEEYIIYQKQRRKWSLYSSYFYPKMEQESKNIIVEAAVRSEVVTISLLMISWFHHIYNTMLGIGETHINSVYKDIFNVHMEDDISFLNNLIKKHSGNEIDKFRAAISHSIIKNSQFGIRYINCGYKMIPLNIKEVQDPLRLKYKPWREYFISNKCNDLIINNISPNFSIIHDWFYIKNSRKNLYDNQSQYNRMKDSELAKDILHTLYESQRGTYFAAENIQITNKNNDKIKNIMNTKFKRLREKINDAINYSVEEIIMSEVTLAFASEYVGRTFADIISIIPNSRVIDDFLGKPFNSGIHYFSKYMFEVCYGLLCLNSKLGVIHGDFHLNNATIGKLYYSAYNATNKTSDVLVIPAVNSEIDIIGKEISGKVMYVLPNNQHYIFPHNGYFSCIIDFSRAIIDPDNYERFNDASIPSAFKLVSDFDKFKINEINNLINMYLQLFSGMNKQREELIVLCKKYFSAVFRLLSCTDIFQFTLRLIRMIEGSKIKASSHVMNLMQKINRMSENYLTSEMNNLIDNPEEYSKKILSEDFPMQKIIRQCFSEYVDGHIFKENNMDINDIYVFENDFKYSASQYETFPDVMKYHNYYDQSDKNDKSKVKKIEEINNFKQSIRSDFEQTKTKNLDMVNYIAMRHVQKLA